MRHQHVFDCQFEVHHIMKTPLAIEHNVFIVYSCRRQHLVSQLNVSARSLITHSKTQTNILTLLTSVMMLGVKVAITTASKYCILPCRCWPSVWLGHYIGVCFRAKSIQATSSANSDIFYWIANQKKQSQHVFFQAIYPIRLS